MASQRLIFACWFVNEVTDKKSADWPRELKNAMNPNQFMHQNQILGGL